MNKGLLALNLILLVAVAILFILFFSKKESTVRKIELPGSDSAGRFQHTPVAYFDMDSVEANFTEFKKMQAEVVKKEAGINESINQMRSNFQTYYQKLQAQAANLTPRQQDSLGNVLAQMDADIKNKAQELNQGYQSYYMGKQTEIVNMIKNYCKEFNKERKYSYIIAREPGLFYYTDSAYNITTELLKGLNAFYNKKK